MAKLFYILLSFILALAFIACTGEKVEETADTDAEATVEKALDENMAKCPGCEMAAMEKEKMIAHEHDGDTTYFCSEKCQEAYLAKEKEEGAEEEETKTEG